MKRLTSCLIAASLAFAPVVAVQAADQPAQQEKAAANFSDAELKSFVTAAIAINDIGERLMPKMQAAEDQNAAAAVREEGLAAMRDAIQNAGLTVDEYKQIAQAADSDEGFRQRIAEVASTMQ